MCQTRKGCTQVFSDTETGENRSIPIADKLRNIIDDLDQSTAKVFGNLEEHNFRRRFSRDRSRAGPGEDVVIHTLRHTVASWLVQQGMPLPGVQKYLGHKTLNMVMRYAHLGATELDGAAELLAGTVWHVQDWRLFQSRNQ